MHHPLLATALVTALVTAPGTSLGTSLDAQPPTDTTRADSARADSARPLRPNPRLRPRPVAPVPRRPGANAGERLAPVGATPAAAATDTARPPRSPLGSGIKVRKESAETQDGTRRP